MDPQNSHSSDERLLAGFAHLLGPMVALIIVLVKKDQPGYVRFQAAQSLAFSGVVFAASLLLSGCMFAALLASFGGMAGSSISNNSSPGAELIFPMLVPFAAILCIAPATLAISAARLIAAIAAFQGKDFRYPWLGERVERFLNPIGGSLQQPE